MAYKASKECTHDWRVYTSSSDLYNREEVQSKVALKYSKLQLDFLYKSSDEDKAPEASTSPLADQSSKPANA